MSRRSRLLGIIIILMGAVLLQAQSAQAGFKFGGAGGRAMAMGGAFTAVADDASALYYNPAGIAQIIEREGMFTHAKKFDVLKVDFIGLTSDRMGFSYIGHGVDLKSKEHGTTRMSESTYGLSIARRIYPKLSIGGTLKALVMKSVIATDTGFGLDLGTLYKYDENLRFGLSTRNVGARVRDEVVPLEVTVGGAYQIPRYHLLLVSDIFNKEDYGSNGSIGYRLGAEMKLKNVVGLRVGVNDGNLTAGAGINQERWGLDGAYVRNRNLELPEYYFSARLKF